MHLKKHLLVVTDLDSSLLDESYSWAAAEPALARLREGDHCLVLNSSKTLAEMVTLAQQLKTEAPLVTENGSVVAMPKKPTVNGDDLGSRYSIQLTGLSRQLILEKAHGLREEFGYDFEGFADWGVEEVITHTGLSAEAAERSLTRDATEPFIWNDSEERFEAFKKSLEESKIRILKGGRFYHLMGMADKADGAIAVKAHFDALFPAREFVLVCLGDSQNDLAMLNAADIAVVIPHADGPHLEPTAPRVEYASELSCQGWNEVMQKLLDELE